MADEILTIETPEHVELHFALATVGNRFLACALDHLIQALALTILSVLAYQMSSWLRDVKWSGLDMWMYGFVTVAAYLIFTGYFIFFETVWSGRTPGKRLLKLRVIQDDGRPLKFFSAMARNLIRIMDMMPGVFYSVGLVSVFTSSKAQRLGDFVGNTVVIKERTAEAPSFEDVFTEDIIDSAMKRVAPPVEFKADIKLLNNTEIFIVEKFLRRRFDIPEHPRKWLAWRIAVPLMEKIRPYYDRESFNYEGFLEEVLARYRAQNKYSDSE